MTQYVLDTDHLSLARFGHARVMARILSQRNETIATSIVSIEEQLTGWYTQIRKARDLSQRERAYAGLFDVINGAANIRVLQFRHSALELADSLRKQYPRLGRNDLAIAAIALDFNAVLVTRNTQDFELIAGLRIEDWSQRL